MNWPGAGNDPFYLNNPTENTARRSFYGINAVFNMKCDGILGNSGSSYQSYFNQRTNVDSPVDIELEITAGATIELTAQITAESNFTGSNLMFRASLNSIEYNIPPGNWTYTHCMDAMLDMQPSPSGQLFSITPGETVTLFASFPVPTYPPTGFENLEVVGFVQNDITKEVLQAKQMAIPLDFPSLSLTDTDLSDPEPGGNNNGFFEPGETFEAWVELTNGDIFANAREVSAILSCDDPDITVIDGAADFGDIVSGASGDNSADPFTIEVSDNIVPHVVQYRLDVIAESGSYSVTHYFDQMMGIPEYLIVDDDGGADYEYVYLDYFDDLDLVYNYCDVSVTGPPVGTELMNYDKIIWFTSAATTSIDPFEQLVLQDYLDAGGKLLISSQNMGDDIGETDFYMNYMHAEADMDHLAVMSLDGVPGDPITDGFLILMVGGAFFPASQSTIIPDAEAYPIFIYTNPEQSIGGLRYSGTDYTLIYLAFPWESLSPTASGFTPRPEVMDNMLAWLDNPVHVDPESYGSAVIASNFEITSVYPNPFNPETTIRLNVPVSGAITVGVFNLLGEKVASIHDGYAAAGSQIFNFDAANLSSGIYLLSIGTPEGNLTKKLVLMK